MLPLQLKILPASKSCEVGKRPRQPQPGGASSQIKRPKKAIEPAPPQSNPFVQAQKGYVQAKKYSSVITNETGGHRLQAETTQRHNEWKFGGFAEIIDNSLEANATSLHISVDASERVVMADDGVGVDPPNLFNMLKFSRSSKEVELWARFQKWSHGDRRICIGVQQRLGVPALHWWV